MNTERKLPRSAWTKGNAPKSPGRPKGHFSIPDAIRSDASKRGIGVVLARLYKENLPLYMAYGFGKPVENLNLTGNVEVKRLTASEVRIIAIEQGLLPKIAEITEA